MNNKRIVSMIMVLIILFCSFSFVTYARDNSGNEIQASGLIFRYNLAISKKDSTTIHIEGLTDCDPVVVKCGFKNLIVQRRASSSSSWSDYYDYGNIYDDSNLAALGKYLAVDVGYQYRVTCKHYAKKNLFSTQTISNTSNIVTF